ncbi:MAG: XRE family transcriptional regulator, partial [Bacteroidia bacterium]
KNIKRFREMMMIKQEALAYELGEDWNQKKISLLEQKEFIEDGLLEQVAKALKVPVEAIKNFDEEAAVNIISNNSFENCDQPASIFYYSTINPIDKWLDALEENKNLYERLLKVEREKNELLQKVLDAKK